eukprot:Seg466.1 transcript_id=Seg466.1/GoldUCD/mRNA.D3Y31 product="UV-stimulated scaffold protein A" pseudo=true protein_id=Seg466.1/GoldUCD/D3Y31
MESQNANSKSVVDILYELVEELTTSGQRTLDEKPLKALKNLCKKSNENLKHVYHMVMGQIEKEHAEIRLSCFQIIDELFMRSHQFRQFILSDFLELLELSVETNDDRKLPPPKNVAKILRSTALSRIEEWHSKFGKHYKKLELGYDYLKRVKKIDFAGIRSRTELERRRQERLESRQQEIETKSIERVDREIKENINDIESAITQGHNCLNLVLPKPDELYADHMAGEQSETVHGDDDKREATLLMSGDASDCNQVQSSIERVTEESEEQDASIGSHLGMSSKNSEISGDANDSNQVQSSIERVTEESEEQDVSIGSHLGMSSKNYSLTITLPIGKVVVEETEDNTDVVTNLKEIMLEIKSNYILMVKRWINILAKCKNVHEQLGTAMKLKRDLIGLTEKYREIEIIPMTTADGNASDENDEDEKFEDVPEKEVHLSLSEDEEIPETLLAMSDRQSNSEKNTSVSSASSVAGTSKDTEADLRRRKLLSKAPVVPFDNDLRYWSDKKMHITPITKNDSLHRFWNSAEFDEEFIPTGLEESLRSRAINFSGKFEKVKWKCRASMLNGKLCERQDRIKCPFHGKIIPRDERGAPSNPDDFAAEIERKRKQEEEEAEEVRKDVEIATGSNLGSIKKKKTRFVNQKKQRYSRLTDLKKAPDASRKRLEKRVLSSAAVKRVDAALNAIDTKRHLEKFGTNFNYHHER